jgi:hypothetical protein
MAKGKPRSKEQPGELLQIGVLTLAMTGGGFFLLYLVLTLFMVPAAQDNSHSAQKEYENVSKLLTGSRAKQLRQDAREQAGAENARSLEEIIAEKRRAYGIDSQRLTSVTHRDNLNGRQLTTAPAPLRQLLSFVVDVREAKKTIQVQSLKLNRPPRSRDSTDDDIWSATVVFLDYEPKG